AVAGTGGLLQLYEGSPADFIFTVASYICLLPVALALHQLARPRARHLSEAAMTAGTAAMLRFGLVLALVALGLLSFMQDRDEQLLARVSIAVWLIGTSTL